MEEDQHGAVSRTVLIDPDGTGPDWAYVVIAHRTSVRYQHQYGGTATRQGELEGYLVPVDATNARPLLDEVFVTRLRSVGSWGRPLEPDLFESVRAAVSQIRFWPNTQGSPQVESLSVDVDRLDEMDEGWVPVVTSDVAGVLVWPNSD